MLPLDYRARLLIYIYINIYIYTTEVVSYLEGPQFSAVRGISSRAAEFGFLPRNWATEFVFSPRNLTFFIRTTIFSQKRPQSSSVTSLFMLIFCLMVMVE